MNQKYIFDGENNTMIIKEGVRELYSDDLIRYISGKTKIVIIADSVRHIYNKVFSHEIFFYLEKIIFSNKSNLEIIGSFAFNGNYLIEEIALPNSCKGICDYAFGHCRGLKSINLANVLYIGYEAFGGCISLQEIEISSSIKYIDEFAFFDCKNLEKIYLPKSVKNRYDGIERILTLGNSAEIILIEDNERTNTSDISSNLEITETPKEIFTPPTNIKRYDGTIRPNLLTRRKNTK